MSRVNLVTVLPGDTNSGSDLNNMLATGGNSWKEASAVVNEENVREEGIDRRNIDFDTNIFHKSFQYTSAVESGNITGGYPGTLAPMQMNSGAPENVQVTVNETNYQKPTMIVRASFDAYTTTAPGGSDTVKIKAKLIYSTNGSTWNDWLPAYTERQWLNAAGGAYHTRGSFFLLAPRPAFSIEPSGDWYIGVAACLIKSGGSPVVKVDSMCLTVQIFGG